jgi:uncharacterized membrane protein
MNTIDRLFWTLTFCAALGCGVAAGVFFAFSTFVMNALARLPAAQGIAAMQAINVAAITPAFMTALFGTGLLALGLIGHSLSRWSQGGSGYVLAGCLLYVGGAVLVTMLCNVPLNEALAEVEPNSLEGAEFWARYLVDWTKWNHVRTLASLFAAALLLVGMRF